MIEKTFTVMNKLGLHARPAALLVQTLQRFDSQVRLRRDDQEVDGKSIMGILTLTAECGTRLTVLAEGPDEQDLLRTLDEFFANQAHEE